MPRSLSLARPPPKLRELAAHPESRRRFNIELFNSLAPAYDRQNRLISFGGDARWKDRLVSMLPAAPNLDAVDLACGTGDVTLRLAARYPDGAITGVDLSAAMLDLARRRDPTGRIRWRCADMCRTGLPDRCADVVTGAWALRLGDSVAAGLAEAARLLRAGGVAAFLDFAQPDSAVARAILQVLLRIWGGAASLLVCGHVRAHPWIAETLRHVPPRSRMARLLENAGFHDLRRCSAFFGVVDLWRVRRRP